MMSDLLNFLKFLKELGVKKWVIIALIVIPLIALSLNGIADIWQKMSDPLKAKLCENSDFAKVQLLLTKSHAVDNNFKEVEMSLNGLPVKFRYYNADGSICAIRKDAYGQVFITWLIDDIDDYLEKNGHAFNLHLIRQAFAYDPFYDNKKKGAVTSSVLPCPKPSSPYTDASGDIPPPPVETTTTIIVKEKKDLFEPQYIDKILKDGKCELLIERTFNEGSVARYVLSICNGKISKWEWIKKETKGIVDFAISPEQSIETTTSSTTTVVPNLIVPTPLEPLPLELDNPPR